MYFFIRVYLSGPWMLGSAARLKYYMNYVQYVGNDKFAFYYVIMFCGCKVSEEMYDV